MPRLRMALGRTCVCFLALIFALASFSSHASAQRQEVTRDQLQSDIIRYIMRYQGFMGQAFDELLETEDDIRLRMLLQETKLANNFGITNIALQPYAEVNLLDVIVFASLTRIVLEDYWAPDVFGPEKGERLIEEALSLENQIWTLAETYLDLAEREELRTLIIQWRKNNSGIIYVEGVRFSDFADEFSDSALARRGRGALLFTSISEAAAEIERARNMGERFLFYAQTIPFATREMLRLMTFDMLNEPDMRLAIENTSTMTAELRQFNLIIEALPDQVSKQIAAEREALMSELDEREGTLAELLAKTESSIKEAQVLVKEGRDLVKEGQELASMVEGTVDKLIPLLAGGEEGSDSIAELQETLKLASSTARETDLLLTSIDRLLNSPRLSGGTASIIEISDVAGSEVKAISNHLFLVIAGLILIAVVAAVSGAFVYRFLASRFAS